MSKFFEIKKMDELVQITDDSVENLNEFVKKNDPLPKDEVFV